MARYRRQIPRPATSPGTLPPSACQVRRLSPRSERTKTTCGIIRPARRVTQRPKGRPSPTVRYVVAQRPAPTVQRSPPPLVPLSPRGDCKERTQPPPAHLYRLYWLPSHHWENGVSSTSCAQNWQFASKIQTQKNRHFVHQSTSSTSFRRLIRITFFKMHVLGLSKKK